MGMGPGVAAAVARAAAARAAAAFVLGATLVASLLAGCSLVASPTPTLVTVTPPAVLTVENRGGPALSIRIDGIEVLQLPCDDTREITPGLDGVPPLPWTVTVARIKGDVFLATQPIANLPEWYLQIGDASMGFGTSPPIGPAPASPSAC